MKIKKFRGKNILETLNQVKREFGENAVILSSEKIKTEEGVCFEITAATEEPEVDINELEDKFDRASFKLNFKGDLEAYPKDDLKGFFKQELMEIKELLKKVLNPQLKHERYVALLEKGIPSFIVRDLVERELELKEYITLKLREKGSIPHSKCQVFIGEGGVGKTSNVFKLAVWYKYRYEAKVLVLSLDTYKVGGYFQVKRLADLLEIDYNILDIEDLKEALSEAITYDYILVDTPCLGKRFGTLELDELRNRLPFLRFQWVVKATEHFEPMLKIWEKIGTLPVEGIFLTFTDKIYTSLPILWLLEDRFPPITFISTGDRIPEDIARAEDEVLINLFLRGIEK